MIVFFGGVSEMEDVRKLVKEISKIGVIAGLLYVIFSLGLLLAGYPHRHAYIMGLGGLLLLPHSVALAYIGSAVKNKKNKILEFSLYYSIILIILPLLGIINNYLLFLYGFAIGSLMMSFLSYMIGSSRRGSLRLSLNMISLTYLFTFIAIFSGVLYGFPEKFSKIILSLMLSYPVPLIYSVTVHALPSTFKDEPIKPLALMLVPLSGISSTIMMMNYVMQSLFLSIIPLILYPLASKMYKLSLYAKQIPVKDKEHPAYKGSMYFIMGHYFVMLSIIIIIIYTLLLKTNYCTTLCIVHSYAMGFIAIHFMIHGPMMLPVILRTTHKKKFNYIPYPLIIASTLLWPISGILSLILFVASLILGFRIVK